MDREELIESVTAAHREIRPDGSVADAPSWHDLDTAGRIEAHERVLLSRTLEAGLDSDELSTTARAVLRMIRR